jgi:cholesterol oxidase
MESLDYDVVVIGSGFGGSVSALRLTEKGYRVGVLEAGRRFADDEYAKTSWRIRRYLWAPALGCFGIMRLTLLRNVLIASGSGVGGGSLVYANTLYEPLSAFYRDPQWADITDWQAELAPYYEQAKKMLGANVYAGTTPADEQMRTVARQMGVEDTFHPTSVGVFFGGTDDAPGDTVADPYFGGAGPDRAACINCGECMTGCRHNAKNTLVKNYLHLAEANGAVIHPLTTVTDVRPRAGGGYDLTTVRTGRWLRREKKVVTAEHVIFAAASLGTQRLLHRCRDGGSLPKISPRLGELSRTNSEAVLSARTRDKNADFSSGVSITSSFHPDEVTHVEPVRYGKGSNLLALMNAPLSDGDRGPRWLASLRVYATLGPRNIFRLHNPRKWSQQSIIVLVMQSVNNSLTTITRRGLFGRRMTSKQGIGEPNPNWIPKAHEVTRQLAENINGIAGGSTGDLVNIPLTAHFIGGCPIGTSADDGVIDPYQRMYGYEGLHVADGSAISANLGVNPSLTITAQAERAMALWPNKGQPDTRPALGGGYAPIAPHAPANPSVPAHAPAALLLPMPGIRAAD